MRKSGIDYLMYTLVDTIVDHYYIVLEKLGEKIEDLEVELIEKPSKHHLESIYKLKNNTLYLKKLVWPLREVINRMIRDENELVSDETRIFLKDVYDHCVHVIETIESYRDLLASMMDLYLNSVSHRLNEVMKVLTVIATIFIPLTFLAGIYGMNFDYMPELHYRYSYPTLIAFMVLIILVQLYFFRKKKWL
jgi:magnesium transporter